MQMPEPVAHLAVSAADDSVYLPKLNARHFPSKDSKPLFTEEQLKQAMRDLLEEAAKRFEDLNLYGTKTADTKGVAVILRAMKEKP